MEAIIVLGEAADLFSSQRNVSVLSAFGSVAFLFGRVAFLGVLDLFIFLLSIEEVLSLSSGYLFIYLLFLLAGWSC